MCWGLRGGVGGGSGFLGSRLGRRGAGRRGPRLGFGVHLGRGRIGGIEGGMVVVWVVIRVFRGMMRWKMAVVVRRVVLMGHGTWAG